MTLTGTTLPSSPKMRVIPSFLPINPAGTVVLIPSCGHPMEDGRGGRRPPHASHLDFDIHARGQAEPHQRIHRLGRRIDDVDQPLVRSNLELLPPVLVDERSADDRVLLD